MMLWQPLVIPKITPLHQFLSNNPRDPKSLGNHQTPQAPIRAQKQPNISPIKLHFPQHGSGKSCCLGQKSYLYPSRPLRVYLFSAGLGLGSRKSKTVSRNAVSDLPKTNSWTNSRFGFHSFFILSLSLSLSLYLYISVYIYKKKTQKQKNNSLEH